LSWYDEHKRDLPWREDRDPYRVWLSEIMLQQTRVAAVLEHYRRFLKNSQRASAGRGSPSVRAGRVEWAGVLRRARMLHAAAKTAVKERAGGFPKSTEELRKLPGIGRYTAAAIASIVYDEPVAGWMVMSSARCSASWAGVSSARKRGKSRTALLDAKRPGDFNQAMMELGATVCLPTPAALLAVSGVRSVRIARRIGNPASGATTAEARNPFRPGTPERRSFPGATEE